jgi:hypothetical protein
MPLSISVADNTDGSGALATVTGSTGGAANSVYVMPVTPAASFAVSGGGCTGDGTVALSLGLGYYLAYAQNVTDGQSSVVYFAVTNASYTAIATRLRAGLVITLQGLVMAGNPNARIFSTLNENQKLWAYPCCTVATAGEAEKQLLVMTGTDDIEYPFRTRILDLRHPDDNSQNAVYELWKEQAMAGIRNQRFAGVPENLINYVDPRPNAFYPNKSGLAIYSMEFLVRCRARQKR